MRCGSIGIMVVGLVCAWMAWQPVVAAEPVRLTSDGRAKRDPVWLNPQGTELLYVVLDKPNRLQLMKLVVADGSTTPLHPDETRAEFEPAVSVDGRYLSFVQNRGNLSLALVVHDRVENKKFEIPPGGGFSGMHSPAFAPDNSRVLFSYPEQGRQSIFSVDLECKNRRTIIVPAKRFGLSDGAHIADDALIRANMQVAVSGERIGCDPVDYARGLEQPHHFVIEMDRARQGIVFLRLFEHDH